MWSARCGAEPAVGPCRAAFKRWYYNVKTGSCESFIYGGCRGNANNYHNESDCVAACTGELHTCLYMYRWVIRLYLPVQISDASVCTWTGHTTSHTYTHPHVSVNHLFTPVQVSYSAGCTCSVQLFRCYTHPGWFITSLYLFTTQWITCCIYTGQ